MRALVVAEPGARLGIERGRLVVRKQGERIASAPGMVVESVTLLGPVGLTTPAIAFLARRGIPVTLLSSKGRLRATIQPPLTPHAEVRRRQVLLAERPEVRLEVARELVRAKMANERALLLRAAREGRAPAIAAAAAETIEQALGALASSQSLEGIRACEGRSSRALFGWMRRFLGAELGFTGRDPAAGDPVNALVNILAALLRSVVHGAASAAGLDPYVGFLHRGRRGSPALVLDLMEEWRPPLVVATAMALIDLGQVGPRDISPDGRLSASGLEVAVARFHWRLDRPAALRGWAKDTTWGGAILEQGRRFARWVAGGPPYVGARVR